MNALLELESYLSQFINFETLPQKNMFWLDTMELLCARFNNPQNAVPAVHVAGSKGKGSVSAMIQSVLNEAGFKCGLFTSPHVSDFSERFTLGNNLFNEREYRAAFEELKHGVELARNEKNARPFTWFELITLYAFLLFRHAKCDWAVFETGMGGRLDATNVLVPRACVITIIEKEHTEYLGKTLGAIAGEKAGIIKDRVPVIVCRQARRVKDVFAQTADAHNAPFIYAPAACRARAVKSTDNGLLSGTRIHLNSPLFTRAVKTTLAMRGSFHAQNAALAALAVKTLFPALDEPVIEAGLARAALPARFEVIESPAQFPGVPFVVIDGAHTKKSVSHTVTTFMKLCDSWTNKQSRRADSAVVFSCAHDKDVEAIAPFFKSFGTVTLTLPGSVKKADPKRLCAAFTGAGIPSAYNADYAQAITVALDRAAKNNCPVLITGSFYLAGEAKRVIHSTCLLTAAHNQRI